jgi:hypothetical protein
MQMKGATWTQPTLTTILMKIMKTRKMMITRCELQAVVVDIASDRVKRAASSNTKKRKKRKRRKKKRMRSFRKSAESTYSVTSISPNANQRSYVLSGKCLIIIEAL